MIKDVKSFWQIKVSKLLSDILESRIDCHGKAHGMKNINKVAHMRLSQTPLRLMSVKKPDDSIQIFECHPL